MLFGVSKFFYLFVLAVSALFLLFPQIDLYVTGLFYDERGFFLRHLAFNDFVYYYGPRSALLFALVSLIVYFVLLIAKKDVLYSIKRRGFLYLFLAMVIGPGLIVNWGFKDHFGRARPAHIEQFGGDKSFTPPLVVTDQCDTNCSFTSGHASAGFYFVALSFLFVGATSNYLFWFGFLYGWLIGFVRIVQGGHFFSDTLFSFIFVYLSSKILYHFMFDNYNRTNQKEQL